jgi:hypothetical protein
MKRSDFRRSDRYLALDNDRCDHCLVSDHVTYRNCCRQVFYVQKYRCTGLLNRTRCIQNYTGIFEQK